MEFASFLSQTFTVYSLQHNLSCRKVREGKALNLEGEDGGLSLTPWSNNGNGKEGVSSGHLGFFGAGKEKEKRGRFFQGGKKGV